MPLWLTLVTIVIGSAFCIWQYVVFSKASTLSDGYSYFDAWEIIKGGHTDQLRTPVFAIFVGVLKDTFGKESALRIIPVIHWLIYVASMQLVWHINRSCGVTRRYNVAVILCLMLIPGFWCFNHMTMAETFATCGMILFIWLSVRYSLSRRSVYIVGAGVTLAALIFTKPMFIFLIPAAAIFWWETSKGDKRQRHLAAATMAAVISLVGTYVYCVHHTHQVVALTIASSWNKYYCLRADGLVIPDEITDPRLREQFRPMYDSVPEGWLVTQPYWHDIYLLNWREINTLNNTAIRNHPKEVLQGIARRFKVSLTGSQFYDLNAELGCSPEYDQRYSGWDGMSFNQAGGFIYPLHGHLWFPIWVGWSILSVYSALWIWKWIRSRKFPAVPFLIASTIFCAYVTTITGAQDSWGRIMSPVNFLLLIMAAYLASRLQSRLSRKSHAS